MCNLDCKGKNEDKSKSLEPATKTNELTHCLGNS